MKYRIWKTYTVLCSNMQYDTTPVSSIWSLGSLPLVIWRPATGSAVQKLAAGRREWILRRTTSQALWHTGPATGCTESKCLRMVQKAEIDFEESHKNTTSLLILREEQDALRCFRLRNPSFLCKQCRMVMNQKLLLFWWVVSIKIPIMLV